jgi:methylmalonyl-CoA mutase
MPTHTESLSFSNPENSFTEVQSLGRYSTLCLQENVPGEYPFTAGLYPFKRAGEDPSRMFAGEGGPERTNKRFHYVSAELQNDCQRF